jgi:nucleoside-diphosphate-sugar epimerase
VARTVAITGATGFIGGHLVQRLVDAGYRVRVLTRRLPVHPIYGDRPIEAVIGGLGDADSLRALLRGADAVVHAAGLVKAPSRAAFFAVNAAGTRAVVEAARAQPTPLRFILLSSLAAREPQLSAYAASKRAAETALSHAGGGLAWSIIRPPAVYGPGDRETLAFFRAAARGLIPAPSGAQARLSMIHVSDLAGAIETILESEAAVEATLEVDDGKPGGYGWAELARIVGAALGTKPRLVRVPRPVLQAIGAINELSGALTGRTPMLTRGKAREICHPDWSCRNSAIRKITSWEPLIPLDAGFAETIAWYRAEGWL